MRLLPLAIAAITLLSVGCNDKHGSTPVASTVTPAAGAAAPATPRPDSPVAAAAAAAKPAGSRYTVETSPVALTVGGKKVAVLKVQPAKGLKFNKDFPSNFVVSAAKHASCDKPALSKRGGDVKIEGKMGVVTIPLTGLAVGTGPLTVQASFSVCSDEQCYVLRGEMLQLPVTVK